ncbi:endosialin [Pipistrellus kuhlii]|uniref:Endosialin n=1 Tax=Pipistrellus kuhlii TaxID=59472 RepID=A0A7J7S015_PIPKU|nr:endosialin [Pipistrellus kuhlii]KAF6281614.1 CD248 molecule [Pipistrellus kuhlii]
MLLRLLLAWAAAAPGLGQAPWAPEPRAACSPGGCYALFPRRGTFLEAWRACRELGGDLATPRTPEEAQRLGSLVGAGPASGLLWIGLQRQARQCQPQRPLRGFTWTTGDQDTAFTNWAQPASASGAPCRAQRCAALEAAREHRWLEGSCTLAVDGYLCQFGFEGSCPALPEEAGQAGPAVYTTPFQLVSTELEWLPFGSVAAVPCRTGREASVLCVRQPGGGVSWSRAGPLCPGAGGCSPDNGGCEQECVEEADGLVSCRCSEGFRLAADGRGCEDPCAQAPCEQQCEPAGPLGYSCHCRLGFRPAEDEPHRCLDTDECQIAGVCQQMCVNYVGGFECYCSEGHELEADGISCSPAGDGDAGARASPGLGEQLLEDGEDEDDEDDGGEAWEDFDDGWTDMPGLPWMGATRPPDFGLAYGPGFPEDREPQMLHLDPTWPPPLGAPRAPHHSSVLSVTRPLVVSATRPTLPSAHQPLIISATRPPLAPAPGHPKVPAMHPALRPDHSFPVISVNYPDLPSVRQPPVTPAPQHPRVPAMHPALHPDQRFPKISVNYPDLPSVHQPPVTPAPSPARPSAPQPPAISAKHPELPTSPQFPMFPDAQVVGSQATTHWPGIPAGHTPVATAPSAHQSPVTADVPALGARATHLPRTSAPQPSLSTTSSSPAAPAHRVPVPAAAQPPGLPAPLPPRSPRNQSAPSSPAHASSKTPQVPRAGASPPTLTPMPSATPAAAPTALGEASPAGRSRRDDRWLLVALLVPTCVFLVVLLALGIVYCTRCGPHAPNKRITDCYRWVTHSGSKGPPEPTPHRGSLTGVQTCRTSV